jgi:uncharacterized protein (TIGR02996 family)
MTHHEGFLRDIIANPEEDVLRLIYADWLTENGEEDYGEFIRVQCRITAIDAALEDTGDCNQPDCPGCVERRALRRRERELLTDVNRWRWLGLCGHPGDDFSVTFRRGFLAEITLPCDQWMRHGPALVRAALLESVRLSDRAPLLIVSGSWVWLRQGDAPEATHTLPDDLAYAMNAAERRAGWDSEAAARKALSVACLKWARNPAPAIH